MKCLIIARLQDFAPNTPGLLGALSSPQTLCREVRDSHCESTNPPLEIPAYGPEMCIVLNQITQYLCCFVFEFTYVTAYCKHNIQVYKAQLLFTHLKNTCIVL